MSPRFTLGCWSWLLWINMWVLRKTTRHFQWQREIYLSTCRILRDQMGESDQDRGFICFMHHLVDFKTNRCSPTTIADFRAENDPAGRHRMMPVVPVRILWPHLPTCSNLNSMETRLRIFMCLHIRAIKPIKPYLLWLSCHSWNAVSNSCNYARPGASGTVIDRLLWDALLWWTTRQLGIDAEVRTSCRRANLVQSTGKYPFTFFCKSNFGLNHSILGSTFEGHTFEYQKFKYQYRFPTLCDPEPVKTDHILCGYLTNSNTPQLRIEPSPCVYLLVLNPLYLLKYIRCTQCALHDRTDLTVTGNMTIGSRRHAEQVPETADCLNAERIDTKIV